MANIDQLIKASSETYTALKDPKAISPKIDDFELIQYKFDTETKHGGAAYYNPNDKSVIIAHRGSATLTDWLKHNPKIAMEVIGKPRETMADVAGKRFTNNMLEMLDRQGNEIGLVLQVGHSLGGRVSQHSLIEVVENLKLDAKGVTFNSAPIKNPTGNVYEHVNLQLSGGNMLNTDIVSAFGKQLGENYKVVSKEINNPISAHLLSNFKHIQNENPAFVKDDLSKVLNHIKQGKDYFEYQAEANTQKSVAYSIPSVKTGTIMKKYLETDIDKLTLVRVQKGIEGISSEKGNLLVGRIGNDSIRNTLHFTLNSVVQDHAYGKFSESSIAIIGNLKETANNNKINGLSPADTWIFQKDGKVSIPNPTLIVPDNMSLPKDVKENINVVVYKGSENIEQNYKNLNKAIETHFEKESLPFKEINFQTWIGTNINEKDQTLISKELGFNGVLPTNHASSRDGLMEESYAMITSLENDIKDNVKLYTESTGLQIPITDKLDQVNQMVKNQLIDANKDEVKYYKDAFEVVNNNINKTHNKENEVMPPPIPKEDRISNVMPPPIPKEDRISNTPTQKENTMSNDQKAYFSSEITPQLNKMNFKTDKVEVTLSGQSVSANLKSNDPTDKANYQAILNENKKGGKELSIIKTERNAENVNISVHQFSQKEIESRKVNLNEKAYSVSHERMGDKTQYHTNDQKSAKELANDIKVNERGTVSFKDNLGKENQPTATIYHGQNSKMVAQLETNSSNANGKSIEHVNNDSKKLEELQDQKKSFNQSVESLKKADLKEFQDLKEKGYKIEVHDLSNQKGKSVQEEKSNIEELKKIADSYKQAEVPRAGKSYSGVILAQGEDTTIQKTPTGKFIVHETENLQQMKVSDTHRNQSIKYVTDKQTDVKSIGYDELKKSQTQEAKQPEQSKSNSNSFER